MEPPSREQKPEAFYLVGGQEASEVSRLQNPLEFVGASAGPEQYCNDRTSRGADKGIESDIGLKLEQGSREGEPLDAATTKDQRVELFTSRRGGFDGSSNGGSLL